MMSERVITGLSAWSHLWADGMTRACWQGSLLILGVWLVCRCFPRLPVDARGWLWWLASLKLLLGLGGVPALPLPLLPGGPPVSAGPNEVRIVRPVVVVAPDRARFAGPAAEVALPSRADATSPRAVSPGAGLWMGLWLGGLAWCLQGIGRQWRAARRLLREARPVTDDGIRREVDRLAAILRLRRLPRLLEAPDAPGPLVAGLWRPALLLPVGAAAQLSPEELRMALAHELAHVRRGDLWWSLTPHLARWLYFFNPLAALACREWLIAREAACDAAALRATGAPAPEYGRLLLKLAAQNQSRVLPAFGATAGFDALKRRITMLQPNSLSRRAWYGLMALVAVGAFAALPWRLTAREAHAAPPHAARAAGAQAAQFEACEAQLAQIGRALAAYRRDHGELPEHLSDLFPRYVSHLKLFHCPADRTEGSPRLADDYDDPVAPPIDPRPISYAYYMSPVKLHLRFGGLGNPLPRGADDSWRGQMLAMRQQYGDRVPVVRCWHHAKTTFEAYSQPLVPSLTLDGAVYRSQGAWQIDPQTLTVVVDRMKNDLAHGAPQFMRNWSLGAIAEQFNHAPPLPAQRQRLRALAVRLQSMAAELSPPDKAAHLATDLPAAVGSLYVAAGDPDRAIAPYQAAMDHLDRTVPYYHLGELAAAATLPALYGARGQHQRAIAVYQKIIQKDPEKMDWYLSMAREYDAMGQWDKARALRQQWDPSGQLLGKPAPDFDIADSAGRPFKLSKLRGRPVVLFFYYNQYARMGEVAHQLDLLQRKYGDRGLQVVCLVPRADSDAATAKIGKDHPYPLLLGADAVYYKYGVRDTSMLFLVDRQGKVATRYLGYGIDPGEERWLERETRKLLGLEFAAR